MILHEIFHAALWRGFHGVAPVIALVIALMIAAWYVGGRGRRL